ncbi:MAG TPA: hypothetical protein ENN69_03405 [Spirochaetia bacterium]|nr:hypothetical protein [Spirochaetia bacterium]
MAKQLNCVDCALHYEVPMMKTTCGPDLVVDRCARCGGIWLDSGEFETLVKLGAFYITHLDKPAETEAERNPERKCPKCKVPLSIMKYEKMPDVELDVCPKCGGLWCDAGELKTIGEAYSD